MSPIMPSEPAPTPLAVTLLSARQRPQRVLQAACQVDDCERDMARLRPLDSVEDAQDRQDLIARHTAARKVLATAPTRRGGAA